MLPKVSVVIAGYNCVRTISETLAACLNQDYPENLREVIFVDDGSTDNTKDIVKKFTVKYFQQNHEGPARARNRGWREAGGEIIVFTDSDCIPDKNWVSSLVENFNNEGIGAVGGSYGISNPENLLAGCIHAEIIWRHKKMPRNTRVLGSYNLAMPKKILQELDGFDETYQTSSGEDNDLCYRLMKKGYSLVFEPGALVNHRHPERLFPYLRHQFRHGFWRMKLYRRHFSMVKGDHYSGIFDFFPPLIALSILFLSPFLRIIYLKKLELCLIAILILSIAMKTLLIFKFRIGIRSLYMFGVLFLRDFCRGVGMLSGIIRFFILENFKK